LNILNYKIKKRFYKTIKKISKFINRIPILEPFGNLKLLWDIVLLAVILNLVFIIPIYLAFSLSSQSEQIILTLPIGVYCIILLVDVLVSLNTSIYAFGVLVQDRFEILKTFFTSS
jgi:hypothetical protein